jgi:hypothetical protein
MHICYVPQLIDLQSLRVENLSLRQKSHETYFKAFLAALKQNGFLKSAYLGGAAQELSKRPRYYEIGCFEGREQIERFCNRNRFIANIRQQPHSCLGDETSGASLVCVPSWLLLCRQSDWHPVSFFPYWYRLARTLVLARAAVQATSVLYRRCEPNGVARRDGELTLKLWWRIFYDRQCFFKVTRRFVRSVSICWWHEYI